VESYLNAIPIAVHMGTPRLSSLDVGKDLAGVMSLRLPVAKPGSVTVTIADPSVALLSLDNRSAGKPQIALTPSSTTVTFYVQGLSDSGTTTVTAQVPGFDPVTATVTLQPSGFAWSLESCSSVLYDYSGCGLYLNPYVLDGPTKLPLGIQTLRFGTSATPQMTNSDPSVATVTGDLSWRPNGYANYLSVTTKAVGTATISVVEPPGFSTPSVRQQFTYTVLTPSLKLSSITMGKDTQTSLSLGVPGGSGYTVTVTSSDPSRLVLSTDPSVPGSASASLRAGAGGLYAQALDNQGTVKLTASADGYNDANSVITLAGVGIGLSVSNYYGGSGTTTTQSPKSTVTLGMYMVNVATGKVAGGQPGDRMRPGVDPPTVTVVSSNPSVGRIERSPATFSFSGSGSTTTVDFVPLAPGDSDVTPVQPPGYMAASDATKISFHVTQPTFSGNSLLMARDTMASAAVSLGSNVQPPTSNLTVTVTSPDPSRLLLSTSPDAAPSASIARVLVAGKYQTEAFYLHALGNSGSVPLAVTAPGYQDGTITVTLRDLAFAFAQVDGYSTIQPVRSVMQNGPQSYLISLRPQPASGDMYGYSQQSVRPGVTITLTVASSDSSTLAADTSEVVIGPGSTSAAVKARPVNPGTAALILQIPDGYSLEANRGVLPVSVVAAGLIFDAPSGGWLGKDLGANTSVYPEVAFAQPAQITISSSDPSRLLVSPDATTPGQASFTVTAQSSSRVPISAQALADNGTVSISVSADGYQTNTIPVKLAPSAVVFEISQSTQTLYTNSANNPYSVNLTALDPATMTRVGGIWYGSVVRPGANLSCSLTSSDPKVLTATPSPLSFARNTSQQVQVRPLSTGTAMLSLGTLSGGSVPASGGQIAFTVAEPDLTVPSLTIGTGLQAPVQVRLASQLPAPGSDLTLTVQAGWGINVSNDLTPSASSSIQVVIPAGQHLSKPFMLQGVYTTSSTSLSVSGPSLKSAQAAITVVPGTFVIQQAAQPQPLALAVGQSTEVTIVPALLPLGTAAPAGMVVRGGLDPIKLGIAVSNVSTVGISAASVTLYPGGPKATVTVTGIGTGKTTVSIKDAPAQQIPNAASSVTFSVTAN
jgi:hypothetical protein